MSVLYLLALGLFSNLVLAQKLPNYNDQLVLEVLPRIDTDSGRVIPLNNEGVQIAVQELIRRLEAMQIQHGYIHINGRTITAPVKLPAGDHKEMRERIYKNHSLTIHLVHPQSHSLAPLVASGEKKIPNYRVYPQHTLDYETGKQIGTRQILVKEAYALSEKDILRAEPDYASNSMIFIELTDAGSKKMEDFTRSLRAGRDEIATIVDGVVINSATLQAEFLSKNFTISGLDNLQQCQHLAASINTHYSYQIRPSQAKEQQADK